jgi:hypothetical protein
MCKMANYLQECLKIVPDLQDKSKNKMNVLMKTECTIQFINLDLDSKERKEMANEIVKNLELVEQKALAKNECLRHVF